MPPKIQVSLLCRIKTCPRIKIYVVDNTLGSRVVCPWPLNRWPENQYGSSTYWAQPLHQVWYWSSEGWAEKSGLTLTFEHVTWKSIGIIYSLRATRPCTKFGIDQVKGSKDIGRTTLGLQTDRPTYRPTESCVTICPLFQGGA